MNPNFLISVICTTYNRPNALNAVLSGLARQTDTNFEIIIADDGSTAETKELIDSFRERLSCRLQHAWQEDKGFRAAAARNLALERAQGDYILLLDGDCIPSPTWVQNHRSLAEKNWSVTGQRILTSENFCQELLTTHNAYNIQNWSLLKYFSLYLDKKINRFSPILNWGIDHFSFWRKLQPNNWKKARSCNWGIWKKDLDAVNGFDESIVGWGHEDADLAIRLMNKGIKFKSGSFATAVLHLWHKEESRNKASDNWKIATSNLSHRK